jgi:uncharacterized protein (DUF433 family)
MTATPYSWKDRLYLPAYQVKVAASYAGVTSQTVRNWQKPSVGGVVLGHREAGSSLSYMHLQELAIVSAMRRLGVKLSTIRLARDYLGRELKTPFPFADERVKSDGQDVLLTLKDELPEDAAETLLVANRGGQLAWAEIVGRRFEQFEYERGLALTWHLTEDRRVVIDPRISFGAPTVNGTPTWVLEGRYAAGETPEEIADDFGLYLEDVQAAVAFERSLAPKPH